MRQPPVSSLLATAGARSPPKYLHQELPSSSSLILDKKIRPDSQCPPSPFSIPSPFATPLPPTPAPSLFPIYQSPFVQHTTYFAQQQQPQQLQAQFNDLDMADAPPENDQSTSNNTDYGDNIHQQQRYKERMVDLRGSQPTWDVQQQKSAPKFRLGFKADCQKCLMRVPGHYAHA